MSRRASGLSALYKDKMSLYGTQSNEQMADNTDNPTLMLISQGSLSAVLCLAGKPLALEMVSVEVLELQGMETEMEI